MTTVHDADAGAAIIYFTLLVGTFIWCRAAKDVRILPIAKRITFRIDDIPIDRKDTIDNVLSELIRKDSNLVHWTRSPDIRSIVQSEPGLLCATVSIQTSLSPEGLTARLQESSRQFRYTHRFEGITPLYGSSVSAKVDIVAVPGLGSHPLGTFKSPDNDDVWLRDFLPQDIPDVRILLYGYDTTLPGSLSKQSLANLGRNLVERIIAFRERDETYHRPIVFIGHSLGGLLIKEALIYAHRNRIASYQQFLHTCYGLCFFGVPHLGLRSFGLSTLVRGQPNEDFVRDLLVDNDNEPSAYLVRLAEQFSDCCSRRFRAVSFFEKMLSPTVERTQDGSWRRTGPLSLLVTEVSATSVGLAAKSEEDNNPLNTDHSNLVKYHSRSDLNYELVIGRLHRLIDETMEEVAARSTQDSM
ncbi:hypothetical protein LZ32DRAFT_523852 [Colletotrichum eremochloae]|nr:hypothetical protein LZ32DRAFT_523852 [Colletotrichum eremochloae]